MSEVLLYNTDTRTDGEEGMDGAGDIDRACSLNPMPEKAWRPFCISKRLLLEKKWFLGGAHFYNTDGGKGGGGGNPEHYPSVKPEPDCAI